MFYLKKNNNKTPSKVTEEKENLRNCHNQE